VDVPSDAKLGLVVGIMLVIAVAVVFFRKDDPAKQPQAVGRATTALAENPVNAITDFFNQLFGAGGQPATPAGRPPVTATPAARTHVIQDGDTLYALAVKYYGDGERFHDLYKANRDVLRSPDRLPAGSQLRIP
jgi:nucleoid-associated protein YgaU